MGKIVSIHSFRGGTGKSNITANLAATIARKGKRVAIVDTDIQSPGIHVLFGLNQPSHTLNDFLWGKCSIRDAAHDVSELVRSRLSRDVPLALFLVPSSLDASEIARVLHEGFDVGLLNDGFHQLMEELAVDYLFIDTHPGVNEETLLSIAISDSLLVVLRPDNQDFQGTAVTLELARKLDVKQMMLLINKAPEDTDVDALREKLEAIYGIPVAGILPLSLDVVKLASGGVFSLDFPYHPFSQEIELVTEMLLVEEASTQHA